MKYSIVTTTINVPVLLDKYVKDVRKYKHDCFFVVVGDKKTPQEAENYCKELAEKEKIEIIYMNVPWQEKYLKDFPELDKQVPYNSIQRRNIGVLYAYQHGAEAVIVIDDDNFFVTKDFVGKHQVGHTKEMDVLSTNTGWINVCTFLKEKYGRTFYHRGIAPEMRLEKEKIKSLKKKVRIVVNAGFWLSDPDVDALTRLFHLTKPIDAVSYKRTSNFALAKGTWSTFNSQNTSIAREVIPAYFLSPKVGRYDDIWAAYVVKRIADHLDHSISYGFPIVRQERNVHNYWKDLAKESDGMQLTLRFVNALSSVTLKNKDYPSCYREIVEFLPKFLKIEELKSEDHQIYLRDYVEGMKVWMKTFERLENLNKKS